MPSSAENPCNLYENTVFIVISNKDRKKLLNAIIYFTENTRYCHKIKLYKLLYFLDFQHYQSTGRSVTGADYYAWPKGPVPVSLQNELHNPEPDMLEHLDIYMPGPNERLDITPKTNFDSSLFSRRELQILERLAKEFQDAKAADMVEATHVENQPWHQIYEKEQRKQELIPYSYSIKRSEEEELTTTAKEHKEFVRNYNDSRDSSF